jgi:hypothetical protein
MFSPRLHTPLKRGSERQITAAGLLGEAYGGGLFRTTVRTARFRSAVHLLSNFSSNFLWFVPRLIEAHFYVWPFFQVHGIDESHLPVIERQDHGAGAHSFAEKSHALQ